MRSHDLGGHPAGTATIVMNQGVRRDKRKQVGEDVLVYVF